MSNNSGKKPKGAKKRGKGRPKLNIDANEVKTLATAGARICEIADYFKCDEKTIANRFRDVLNKARAERRIRLRAYQNKLAETGNATMLIWLGKNELGQEDSPQRLEHSGPDGEPIKTKAIHSVDYDAIEAQLTALAVKRLAGGTTQDD